MATPPAPTSTQPSACEPSGVAWIARFPTSASVDDCAPPFRDNLVAFIAALRAAGAGVNIAATVRPRQRAWLMHWCWAIVKAQVDPRAVPQLDDVAIAWAHADARGAYDAVASMAGARAMLVAYGMQNLSVAPALSSNHILGTAVDMAITWSSNLTITPRDGEAVTITSLPRTGMNAELKAVGASYGVLKFVGGASDIPHWSADGH